MGGQERCGPAGSVGLGRVGQAHVPRVSVRTRLEVGRTHERFRRPDTWVDGVDASVLWPRHRGNAQARYVHIRVRGRAGAFSSLAVL